MVDYPKEISDNELLIAQLQRQLQSTRLPPRTIAWQHANGPAVRGTTVRRVLLHRRTKAQLNSQINSARAKVCSLRESILGL